MGMAASQVRFLSLQHRKNSIGRQLSTLSNRKMSLSRDMNDVSRHYTEALNRINLKWSNDCGNTYHALSYDMLMKPNDVNTETPYILTNARNGKVVLNDSPLYHPDGTPMTTGAWTNIAGETLPAGDLSYLRIAKMISSFSSISDHGEVHCNKLEGFAQDENGNWVGKANPGAYYIPANDEFSFENNLRMKIFMAMGLVTKDQIDTQNSMLTELYGSQEAKETGIYPVGSAWGDYYIALANLEAYDAYVSTDQVFANSDLLTDTGTTTLSDYRYTESDYQYVAYADGKRDFGSSTVTQTCGNTKGAAAHVDFAVGVVKNNISGYYEETVLNAGHTIYNDSKYNNSYGSIGDQFTLKTSLNANGVIIEYTTNDLLASALKAMREIDSTAFDNGDGTTNAKDQDEWDTAKSLFNGGNVVVAHNGGHKAWTLDSYDETSAGTNIKHLISNFTKIIKNQTLIEEPENFDSILQKAETATYTTAYANKLGDYMDQSFWNPYDGVEVTNNAKTMAENTAITYAQKGWHWLRPWNKITVACNTKILFDMYMSYVSYYMENPEASAETISTISSGLKINTNDTTDADGNPIPNISHTSYNNFNGSLYEQKFATGSTSGGASGFTISRSKLTTTKPSDEITGINVNGTAYYYEGENETVNALGSYSVDASGNITYNLASTVMDINDANKNKTVYGVVSKGTSLYYFTDENKFRTYLTNGTLNGGYVEIVDDVESTTGNYIELFNENNNIVNIDSTNKANQKSNSDFAVKLDGKPVGDLDIRKKLQDAVNKAKDRIEKLEADIEDFYSESDKKIMDYYDAIFLRIAEQGWEQDEHTGNATYLNNKIQNNDFFLTECLQKNSSTGFRYTAKQATNISKIFSVHDTNAEQEALVEYESEKRRLQYKENAIDTRMRILETEQEAINTEMESVQKVCNDNISKYFKIFA